jgi:hypothetical protein
VYDPPGRRKSAVPVRTAHTPGRRSAYREHAGSRSPIEQFGGRWIELNAPQSTTTVALTPAREDAPAGIDTGIRFTTQDAAALHNYLTDRGVDVDELLRWEGVPPMFDFHDLDGNVLYVSEPHASRTSGRARTRSIGWELAG